MVRRGRTPPRDRLEAASILVRSNSTSIAKIAGQEIEYGEHNLANTDNRDFEIRRHGLGLPIRMKDLTISKSLD